MKTLIIVRKSILIVLLTFFVFKSNVILSQKNNTKDNKKPADTVKIVDTNSETLNKLKDSIGSKRMSAGLFLIVLEVCLISSVVFREEK